MRYPLITLTTDFGQGSSYVAAMKGVLLAGNPRAQLIDLSHSLPPQDIRAAALLLDDAVPYFPAETLHVVVVDPGVGTDRSLVFVRSGCGSFLAPDNGVLGLISQRFPAEEIYELRERRYWRAPVSATFHGRDILAPVASHLSQGLDPAQLGPRRAQIHGLALPEPVVKASTIHGEILHVDSFGNLISNVRREHLHDAVDLRQLTVGIQGKAVTRFVTTFGEAVPGTLVLLFGSTGRLEIAVVDGNAATELGILAGAPVTVHIRSTEYSEERGPT